jgi:hypothetical protein
VSNLIYQSSKPVFIHILKNLSSILKTAARDAKARDIEPAVILDARLSPDMLPLTRQVQMVTDHAKGCCSRLASIEVPTFSDNETTFAELETRIQNTVRFLRGLKASQFVGSESREVVMQLPIGTLSFSGIDFLNGWSLPNFYFHYSTAYNILRHNGVAIGKLDLLGVMPGMTAKGKIKKMMNAKPAANVKKKR